MIEEATGERAKEQKRAMLFRASLLVTDERLREAAMKFPSFEVESVRLEDVLDGGKQELEEVLNGVKEDSAKDALLGMLKRRALIKAAKERGVAKVFTAESATSLAVKLWMIENAEHTVDVIYYILRDDAIGTEMTNRLVNACERGVRVFLLWDEFGCHHRRCVRDWRGGGG